jgi:hypothetical protein
MKTQTDFLESLQFGSSIAEDETKYLQRYFVDTSFWRNLSRDRYDIILGQKGCGKSALYLNLLSRPEEFRQNKIILVEGENPRGDTVFSLLNKAAKNSSYENPNVEALIESDVIDFWKMYFLVIAVAKLRESKFKGKNFKIIYKLFEETKLLPSSGYSLDKIFNNVIHFLKQVATLDFFQPEAEFNPLTGTFSLKGKISFKEYSAVNNKEGFYTSDDLFEKLNEDLETADETIWFLLDRLDVAFIDSKELERRALKSLFLVYNSLKKYDNIRLKIFLRSDIMAKVSYDGLREASHLANKMTTILIDNRLMFNILVRRVASNEKILIKYGFDEVKVLSDVQEQQRFLTFIFPDKTEGVKTFDWLLENIKDANDSFTPREMISFLLKCRECQLELLDQGYPMPEVPLISPEAIQKAIRLMSNDKFNLTLIPENPDLTDKLLLFNRAPLKITAEWLKTTFPELETDQSFINFVIGLSNTGFLTRIDDETFQVAPVYRYALGIQ